MISEKKFATSYASFWNSVIPTGDRFIRVQNLQLTRFSSPVESQVPAGERGVIGELSFRFFCHAHGANLAPTENIGESLSGSTIDTITSEATNFVRRFRELSRAEVAEPSDLGKREAVEIAEKLRAFVALDEVDGPIVCSPEFDGCGLLDSCSGDLLTGHTLFEIKAVDRTFRAVDLRQLLTYLALNYASSNYEISRAGLLNPRRGVYTQFDVDWLCHEISGSSANELLNEIVEFSSQTSTSR